MPRKRRLKSGDRVQCSFLGSRHDGTILEETKPWSWKIKCDNGTILPNVKWYIKPDKKNKKLPWYIHDYLGGDETSKSEIDKDIKQNTSKKNELDSAIKKQKDFIRGKHGK